MTGAILASLESADQALVNAYKLAEDDTDGKPVIGAALVALYDALIFFQSQRNAELAAERRKYQP